MSSLHTLIQDVIAKETTKTYVRDCPTYCLWFEHFVKGVHNQMGDDRHLDVAICLELMKEIMTRVEVDFQEEEKLDSEKVYCSIYLVLHECLFWISV